MGTTHDSPATAKGSKHVCKRAGCKRDNYKARPAKPRPYLGSSMPSDRKNIKVLDKTRAMKFRPRSERQARRVELQQWHKARNAEYYQDTGSAAAWKSGR